MQVLQVNAHWYRDIVNFGDPGSAWQPVDIVTCRGISVSAHDEAAWLIAKITVDSFMSHDKRLSA